MIFFILKNVLISAVATFINPGEEVTKNFLVEVLELIAFTLMIGTKSKASRMVAKTLI